MANWKRQVGIVNRMGRRCAKHNSLSMALDQKTKMIDGIVKRLKGKSNENAGNI